MNFLAQEKIKHGNPIEQKPPQKQSPKESEAEKRQQSDKSPKEESKQAVGFEESGAKRAEITPD